MLCCLAVQLQALGIGVTTRDPNSGPLPFGQDDIFGYRSDQYWAVYISDAACVACHYTEKRKLTCNLCGFIGSTIGCHVSETGELHLHLNGRDVGVAWEGLPTDQPLWGFVEISDWTVKYIGKV